MYWYSDGKSISQQKVELSNHVDYSIWDILQELCTWDDEKRFQICKLLRIPSNANGMRSTMKQKDCLLSSGKAPNNCCKTEWKTDSAHFTLSIYTTTRGIANGAYLPFHPHSFLPPHPSPQCS